MIVSPARLQAITQKLAQEPDFLRIKKLLIYACTQIWQSDPEQIQAIELAPLLQTLLNNTSTPERLQTHLHTVVGTLNKASDYARIAETLIAHITPLYPTPCLIPVHADASQYQDRYSSIATALNHNSEQVRIKKLLILSCRNEWMSDRTRLAEVSWIELIQELHRLAPTLASLQVILSGRVKKLSKPEEYRCIASQVIQAMQMLYDAPPVAETQFSSTTDTTEFLSGEFLSGVLSHGLSSQSQTSAQASTPAIEIPPVVVPLRLTQPVEAIDLFDVRLELMQYSNPLRLKILLFSLLHEIFTATFDQHLILKGYELDESLRIMLQTYKQFDDLTTKLTQTATQLDSAGDYGAVAQTILRTVKPLYSTNPAVERESVSREGATGLMRSTVISDGLTRPEYS
ncbi:MAG TPA: hypothetical protein V6C65_03950 [Allocoleopsis sp.]